MAARQQREYQRPGPPVPFNNRVALSSSIRPEFSPLQHIVRTKKLFMLKSEEPTTEPDTQSFLQDPERQQRLAQLGREGWELVSVQPVVRGEIQIGNQNAQGWAYGIVLPTGYLLFFKRPISSD